MITTLRRRRRIAALMLIGPLVLTAIPAVAGPLEPMGEHSSLVEVLTAWLSTWVPAWPARSERRLERNLAASGSNSGTGPVLQVPEAGPFAHPQVGDIADPDG